MYLFFDTETTGLPRNYNGKISDLDNWPRVIQLAWAYYDERGVFQNSRCDLIKPDGWEMPKEKFWTDNGYSQEKSLAEGIPIKHALVLFNNCLYNTKYLIAHNMQFDHGVLGSEYVRAGLSSKNKPVKLCTKELSTQFCEIPSRNGIGFKWPSLTELHNKLFGSSFDGAHDALNDVMACSKCFFELQKLEVIKNEK